MNECQEAQSAAIERNVVFAKISVIFVFEKVDIR